MTGEAVRRSTKAPRPVPFSNTARAIYYVVYNTRILGLLM